MRILISCDPMLPVPPLKYGGIERIAASLIEEYKSRGHQVALLAKAGSTSVVDRFYVWPGENVSDKRDTFINAHALWRAARDFKADLVHSFSRLAYLIPLLILNRRLPKIMSYQRHVGARQIRWSRRMGGPQLRFTGCSNFICEQGRVGGGAWHAIPNFVDTRKFDFVSAVEKDAPLVFLSRIESIKGVDLAIAIAKKTQRRLIIAGNRIESGPEAKFFAEKVAPHLDQHQIEWIGEVDDTAKNKLLGSAAALVVPVQWDEPFGIVFAEALATGTPVITCARGALPEIVTPGKTGFFITNVEEAALAVSQIPTLDRTACRVVAETKFSLSVCADQYLTLYKESLK
ncbi:MAG: glycosyltransferase [Verrucomicrobia bacterium]|nr:glycosyltransferase [Verrucomicrobiota bacterium]